MNKTSLRWTLGLGDDALVEGARQSVLDELAECTLAADQVLVF